MSAATPTGPRGPLPPRVGRIQAAMRAEGIDVLVCFKPENTFLLSGFNPILYSHPVVAIVPAQGEPVMLVHALRDDHGRASAFLSDIRLYGAWSTKVTMGPSWLAALGGILGELGAHNGSIGLEEEFVSIARFAQLKALLPDARFCDTSKLLDHVRLIKDPDEIALARIAGHIADVGMNAAVAALAQGGSERDIAISAMHAMNRHWADHYPDIEVCDFGTLEGGAQNGLWSWVLVGDRMFMNCDNPTNRRPKRGEAVALFIWSVANGLHAENERTVAYGALPKVNRKAIDDILSIRDEVIASIRPGTPVKALFAATKAGLEKRGYGRFIPGRIGHGIGIGAHEHASIDAQSPDVLLPGMIFTLEPNLRIPGIAATQISDTVLVTEAGFEFLTTSAGGYLEV